MAQYDKEKKEHDICLERGHQVDPDVPGEVEADGTMRFNCKWCKAKFWQIHVMEHHHHPPWEANPSIRKVEGSQFPPSE